MPSPHRERHDPSIERYLDLTDQQMTENRLEARYAVGASRSG
jgi:hypothetical protein